MDERNLVSINKNKEPEIDTYEYYFKLLESFPSLERDVLKLRLGLETKMTLKPVRSSKVINVLN